MVEVEWTEITEYLMYKDKLLRSIFSLNTHPLNPTPTARKQSLRFAGGGFTQITSIIFFVIDCDDGSIVIVSFGCDAISLLH